MVIPIIFHQVEFHRLVFKHDVDIIPVSGNLRMIASGYYRYAAVGIDLKLHVTRKSVSFRRLGFMKLVGFAGRKSFECQSP